MEQFWSKLWRIILDSFFPAYCLGCKTEGNFLCSVCQKTTVRLEVQICPWCYLPTPSGRVCDRCREGAADISERFLDGIFVFSRFEEHSLIQKAIHEMKYEFIAELSKPLGKLLAEELLRDMKKTFMQNHGEKIILCPLPLHRKRQQWRGFNQAELLCMSAAEQLHQAGFVDFEVVHLLERVHFSRPQMELNRQERIKNIQNSFAVRDVNIRRDEIIFIVDDIATTLSTLNSAAKVLKKAGFEHIYGLVLARVF